MEDLLPLGWGSTNVYYTVELESVCVYVCEGGGGGGKSQVGHLTLCMKHCIVWEPCKKSEPPTVCLYMYIVQDVHDFEIHMYLHVHVASRTTCRSGRLYMHM